MPSSTVTSPLICLAIAAFTGIQIGMDQGVLNGIVAALIWVAIYVVSSRVIPHLKRILDEMEREGREGQKKFNDRENEKAARKAGWPFQSIDEAEAAVSIKYADLHLSANQHRRIASLLFFGWVESEITESTLTLTRAEKTQTLILDRKVIG